MPIKIDIHKKLMWNRGVCCMECEGVGGRNEREGLIGSPEASSEAIHASKMETQEELMVTFLRYHEYFDELGPVDNPLG